MRQIVVTPLSILAATLLTGCVTTGPQPPRLSYDEAATYERSLKSHEVPPFMKISEGKTFTQPVNKKEPCLLPTSKDQLERSNFKAYWDGQCRNGYAFGLGRDIAISNTHHVEEITVYKGQGDNEDSPAVLYDFVNNKTIARTAFAPFPKHYVTEEAIINGPNGFNVQYTVQAIDESARRKILLMSPLNPARGYVVDERNVAYRFADNRKFPFLTPDQVNFSVEILDPATGKPGLMGVIYGNGVVRHFRQAEGKLEPVQLPTDYLNYLTSKMYEANAEVDTVEGKLEPARRMEREYLYMACNGKHVIEGLAPQQATKICDWRAQFKEPYEKAVQNAKQQMEQLTLKAEAAAKERQARQQIAAEQQRLEAQQSQLAVQSFMTGLNQMSQQFLNNSTQMLNGVMSQPAPSPNFGEQGKGRVTCSTVGAFTTCR